MTDNTRLFDRKVSLLVFDDSKALDLSEFHIKFKTEAGDFDAPPNCRIRIYNVGDTTLLKLSEYSSVVLQAGYEGQFGVIFKGTVKYYVTGKENATDTYVDILAADGDTAYNFGVVKATLEAGASPKDQIKAAIDSVKSLGVSEGYVAEGTGGVLPRGKVLFGMGRDFFRRAAASQGATWSISGGKINIVPLDGYLPGEAVVLNAATGMVGIPEQTLNGVNVSTLLNPRIINGSLVQIDNKSINQTSRQDPNAAPIPYNQWTGLQLFAKVTSDGVYRVYVSEHEGDTRGQAWHTHLVCLSVDPSTNKVKPYG